MAAFRTALALGVSTLETDLAITKDDVVVISHDPTLNPDLVRGPDGQWIAPPGPAIRTLTLAELKRFDIGRLNPQSRYAQQFPDQKPVDGERFPTLAELFAAAPSVRFNIEIKTDPNRPDLTVDPAQFARLAVDAIRHAKQSSAAPSSRSTGAAFSPPASSLQKLRPVASPSKAVAWTRWGEAAQVRPPGLPACSWRPKGAPCRGLPSRPAAPCGRRSGAMPRPIPSRRPRRLA